ncbi:MAG: rod shape-determining protein MreC [Candidatus Omnitrophota bacterium]|nr:rod shape-determining protein MreC [Candidatus Omnitrophota bacterium]
MCSGAGRYFHSKRGLSEENRSLRGKIGDLSLRIDQLKELRNENKRLRALLRFEKGTGFDTVPAEVVARDPNDWVGSFVIDKGTADGVHKGAAVCSAKGLLGEVVESGENTSSVMLITHPNFRAGAMLKGTRVNGIVEGAGKGMVKIKYIPIDADVRKGMIVITSGLSRVFPKGINIGEIVLVEKSRTGLYKNATVKPSANLFDQEIVLCIK